jgi:amino acid transporter
MSDALKKSLGLVHLAAIGLGTTIGVGWIVVTGGWILEAGPGGAALAFALGGVVMTLVGLAYAEVATRLPDASGEYGYVTAMYGRGAGFVVGWFVLLGFVGICCFEGLALAWLISVLMPGLAGPALYTALGSPVHVLDIAVVAGGAVFFTAVNYAGARESARVQVIVTALKVVLSLAFIVMGLWLGASSNLAPLVAPTHAPWLGVAAILVVVPAWFCGFNALPQALAEAKTRPSRGTLAWLLISVIIGTSVFYMAVIAATAAAAPREMLAQSELPVVTAIKAVAGPWGGRIVLITGVIALLSAWNAAMFAASRLLFTLARDGSAPGFMARVHDTHGTPHNAVLFVGVVALGGGLMGRAFIEPLIQIGALGFAAAFVATCLVCLKLPREPHGSALVRLGAAVGVAALMCVIALSVADMAGRGARAEFIALLSWLCLGVVFLATARLRARSAA